MKVYIFLADGFEEIEGLTVVDIMRRAKIDVETISITGQKQINGAHKIIVEADRLFEETDFSDGDMLVLPGGMPGTLNLKEHEGLRVVLGESAVAVVVAVAVFDDRVLVLRVDEFPELVRRQFPVDGFRRLRGALTRR